MRRVTFNLVLYLMKKLLLSVAALAAATGTLYGQSYTPDVLKFSQTNYGSTARFKGMAGAQIGVGGDMSSLGSNPAGLGLFTRSEFTFTPEFNGMTGKANFLNQNTESSKSVLNLNNAGVVFYSPSWRAKGQDTKKGVISTVFGIGYNRNNDFGAEFSYLGTNPSNSIADYFRDDANFNLPQRPGAGPDDLPVNSLGSLGYEGYLIDFDEPNGQFLSSTRNNSNAQSASNSQYKNEIRSGSTSELNVAGALNISNQVYIGASVGLVNVRYISDGEFRESGYNFAEDANYSLVFRRNQETTGTGINARLGVIFRPADNFRIGGTLQTPSWMLIEDNTSFKLNTSIGTNRNYDIEPINSLFTYRVRTPLKGSLGASYVIAGKALVSADVDYIDYSSIRFSTDQGVEPGTIAAENRLVKDYYKSTANYRVGAEYKIDNALSIRGGYGLNGSAIKGDSDYFATKIYTGGLGYRVNNYYFDVAYQHLNTNTELAPYEVGTAENPEEPVADIKTQRNNVFLTFGVRF